jgi:phosphoribosylamine--glycine ligase
VKILMLSKEGDGLGVAHRLVEQGHECFVWIKDPAYRESGKGIVTRVPEWRPKIPESDLVVCDMVGFGHLEELFRRFVKPTLCCSFVLEQAELDRKKGMQLFKAMGLEIPETYAYQTPDEARKAIPGMGFGERGWYLKGTGDLVKSSTACVRDEDELESGLKKIPRALIAQRCVSGIEISTEGWFNGRDFLRPFNHTFEEKKFLVGDLGPTVGCMGSVVRTVGSNRLTQATVEKLKPFLSKISYKGPVDVNCIVDKEHAWALEITARFGYDAVEALLAGLEEPIIDLFFEVATGTKKQMKVSRQTMMALSVTVPPFPSDKETGEAGIPVKGLSDEVLRHTCLMGVRKNGKGFETAGDHGTLLSVTALGGVTESGDFVREAQRRVYRTANGIDVQGKQYRTDVGDRVVKQWGQLAEWGWLT